MLRVCRPTADAQRDKPPCCLKRETQSEVDRPCRDCNVVAALACPGEILWLPCIWLPYHAPRCERAGHSNVALSGTDRRHVER